MNINFYQLISTHFLKTICKIIEKGYYSKYRIFILTDDILMEQEIDRLLWTYSQKIFIPHGSSKDMTPQQHPVYISTKNENLNDADLLLSINCIPDLKCKKYKKILYIFSEENNNILQYHNMHKKNLSLGIQSIYHMQMEKGWKLYDGTE